MQPVAAPLVMCMRGYIIGVATVRIYPYRALIRDRRTSHTFVINYASLFEFQVDALQVHPGERFDFVLHTTTGNITNYWIRVYSLPTCMLAKTHQEAIIRYEGAPDDLPPEAEDFESPNRAVVVRFHGFYMGSCSEFLKYQGVNNYFCV